MENSGSGCIQEPRVVNW